MNLKSLLLASLMLATALAGCSDDPVEKEEVFVPGIDEDDIQEIEERATEQFPREIEFPDQEALETVSGMFEGTLAQFEGAGVEWPDDNGNIKGGGEYLTFDMKEFVPAGQPVEMRLKLKWWGDPGAAVDMDIFVDVPGEQDSYDGTSYDESWNWNIVTKFRVINTVHVADQPLTVGMELQNGKIVHPDGVYYQLFYDLHFPGNVLAPGIAYEVSVPEDASALIFESEPLVGDEHVTSDVVIYGPDDQFFRFFHYNDIASETLAVNLPSGGGKYVVYAQHYHGGFWRIETDVQNPGWEARALTTLREEKSAASGAAPAPSGRPSSGTIDAVNLLDVTPWIRHGSVPASGAVDAEFAITNNAGDYAVVAASGQVDANQQLRLGTPTTVTKVSENFEGGGWGWGWRNNGEGLEGGYTQVTYSR